jgi:hypothetical protein
MNATLKLDLVKHNEQYPEITILENKASHDRFLLIDEKELLDNQNQTADNITDETSSVPEATPEVNAPVEELPEKYRGKSAIDIARMHQEAEKLIGRQANEVHEVRSLADQLLKQQLDSNKPIAAPIEESLEDDFFVDPNRAVARAVEKHPAVIEAKNTAMELRKNKTAAQLSAKHPDFGTIVQDTGFQDWVKASPIRLNMFAKADAEYDFDSANELLSTYKEIKQIRQTQQVQKTDAVEARAQDAAMRAATVDVGGTGESSKKVYRRADLIKLRMTDPDRYMALQDEIMSAYAQGRVK